MNIKLSLTVQNEELLFWEQNGEKRWKMIIGNIISWPAKLISYYTGCKKRQMEESRTVIQKWTQRLTLCSNPVFSLFIKKMQWENNLIKQLLHGRHPPRLQLLTGNPVHCLKTRRHGNEFLIPWVGLESLTDVHLYVLSAAAAV